MKDNKDNREKIIIGLLILITLFVVGCSNLYDKKDNSSKEVIKSVNVNINGNAKTLVDMLPLDLNMNELNGNEKYIYLNKSLPTNSSVPKKINAGDVMVYGDSCLVIFYKTFDTTYSYTKIGHIDNLPEFDDKSIRVKISK